MSKVETVEPVVPGIEGWNYEKDFALLYIPTLDVTKINAVKSKFNNKPLILGSKKIVLIC